MPTVAELSDPYANFMRNPLPPDAEGVCRICLTFTSGYDTCYRCGHQQVFADRVLPISYSVHFGQLHTALAGYKRSDQERVARTFRLELAAVLWRFLVNHEQCLAAAVGVHEFDLVTTVPSSSRERDVSHPLREMVGVMVEPTAPLPAHTRAGCGPDWGTFGRCIEVRSDRSRPWCACAAH